MVHLRREIVMAVHLNLSNLKEKENEGQPKLHLMPCVIKSNGEAKVSTYFEPIITPEEDGTLKASFRGYPLMGKELKVPDNYTGIILQGTEEQLNENAERNLYGTQVFDKFTYWNWDEEPSANDKIVSALEWLEIAEAVS